MTEQEPIPTRQLNVEIPESLKTAFDVRLAQDNRSAKEVLVEMIREYVDAPKPEPNGEERLVLAFRQFLRDYKRKPVALRLFYNLMMEGLKPYLR